MDLNKIVASKKCHEWVSKHFWQTEINSIQVEKILPSWDTALHFQNTREPPFVPSCLHCGKVRWREQNKWALLTAGEKRDRNFLHHIYSSNSGCSCCSWNSVICSQLNDCMVWLCTMHRASEISAACSGILFIGAELFVKQSCLHDTNWFTKRNHLFLFCSTRGKSSNSSFGMAPKATDVSTCGRPGDNFRPRKRNLSEPCTRHPWNEDVLTMQGHWIRFCICLNKITPGQRTASSCHSATSGNQTFGSL